MNHPLDIIEEDALHICQKIDFKKFDGKDILITGASGLLGLYFLACVKKAKELNASTSGKIMAVIFSEPEDYTKELFEGVEVFRGDLSDYAFCQSLPTADFIIHAAGYGQPGRFMEKQIKTLKLNTLATFCLFDKLKEHGNFLFLSSSEVYSGLQKPLHTESDIGTTNTDHPRSCYIEGKRGGEAICQAQRQNGVQAKVARLALAYGPGTKVGDMRALNMFIEKGLVKGKIALLDQGAAIRTYCYVADAVEILLNILVVGKECIYNVGGESQTTIKNLADVIAKQLGVSVEVPEEKESFLSEAPLSVGLDITKVKQEFSKNHFISLEQGIEKTIQWQRFLYSNHNSI